MMAPGVKYPADCLPGEPVGGQCHPLTRGLLNPKLSSSFIPAGYHVGSEIKCTKR